MFGSIVCVVAAPLVPIVVSDISSPKRRFSRKTVGKGPSYDVSLIRTEHSQTTRRYEDSPSPSPLPIIVIIISAPSQPSPAIGSCLSCLICRSYLFLSPSYIPGHLTCATVHSATIPPLSHTPVCTLVALKNNRRLHAIV